MAPKAIIEIQYFPPVAYFTAMLKYGGLIIESFENYQKQSFRNRCRILTANKVDDLIVPVVKGNSKTLIRDLRIDYSQKWVNRHWRAIRSGYGKSPFFEHYEMYIYRVIEKKHPFLFDKNIEIIETLNNLINLDVLIQFNSEFQLDQGEGIDDLRGVIHPKSKPGYPDFINPANYTQLFPDKFIPNLSILDLLFCDGPNTENILQSSIIL